MTAQEEQKNENRAVPESPITPDAGPRSRFRPNGGPVEEVPDQISMVSELLRKSIHLASLGIPIIYWNVSWETMLQLLVPATLLSLIIELLRRRYKGFEEQFRKVFGAILRPHESSYNPEINGATFVLVSATICVAILPKIVAITGFTVLIISDTASALYGRRFGKRKFCRKSLEGSMAFLVTAMLVVGTVAYLAGAGWIFIAVGFVASVVATLVEAVSHGGSTLDDNLTIPTAFGAVMWAGLALADASVLSLL